MKQISCITKRADISQDEYIRIWHGDHRKVAIETQSTFGYVRNEIFRTPGHTEGAGPEGQLGIDMSPMQPHTIGRARSCESCHGAAQDWLELHSDYGGPNLTRELESREHRQVDAR